MPTKVVKPTADFSQVLGELKKLSKHWEGVAKAQATASKESVKTASNIAKQTTSITKLTDGINKLTKAYSQLLTKQKAQAITAAKSVQADKEKSREIAKQIKLTDRMIQRGYTQQQIKNVGATQGEILNYKNEYGKLKELQVRFGGMKAQVNKMWADLAQGNIIAYTGKLRLLQNQLIKVRTAQQQLGVAARKAYDAKLFAKYDQAAAAFVKQHKRINGVTGALIANKKAADSLTISWRSFVRLLAVQIFHQAVAAFTRAVAEAVVQVIELEKRISEVQTISQDIPLPFEEWRDGFKEISDQFGLPILDTVEGAYQTLSNQITEGAKTFEFMSSASKFAVTAVASTADSVNLLTAALNAFNLDVDRSDELAAKFFKTIELGRVRAGEMAETFGRIAVPANQLSISIEELQAAIASATIQGLKYNEAATLIRNVLLKLIRPTDAMKALFAEWGVESGEAAIKTFGFAGVLAKIEEHSQGSSTALGELFGRIRAITGAMLFAGEGLVRYDNALEQIKNSQDDYGRRTEIVMENAGKRLEIEFNKIKNFFTVDLTDKALRTIDSIAGGFGSLSAIVKSTADTFAVFWVGALTAASLGVTTLTANIHLLTAAMRQNLIIAGLIAGIYATNYILRAGEANADKIDEATKRNQEDWKKRELKNIEDVHNTRLENIKEAHVEQLKALAEIASVSKFEARNEQEIYERFIQLRKRLGTEVTSSLKNTISSLKKEIRALNALIDTAEDKRDFEESIKEVTIQRRLSGADRDDQLEPTAERKYEFLNAELVRLQEEARRAAFALDQKGFDRLADDVKKRTAEVLAIRDADKELSSLIHGQTYYNNQIEQLAITRQLMADLATKESQSLKEQSLLAENQSREAQKLVDFLAKQSLTDFFKIKDPLELEAAINEQLHATEELLKIQAALGKEIKDPVSLAKASAELELTAAKQINRLRALEEAARINAIDKEFKIREENQLKLNKLIAEGIHIWTEATNEGVKNATTTLINTLRNLGPNRAAGGHGIDTQMARISPDEIVMNPGASKKFYSTLTAMNAGVQRFADGGSPTNYNIGDINLSAPIQGGKVDVLSLGKGLRREIRRGRLRLH